MPHVMVDGPCTVEQFHTTFTAMQWTVEGAILKLRDCFLNTTREEVLVEAVVVEGKRMQSFFISLSQRRTGVIAKLPIVTDPEKTEGVKRLIACVGGLLKQQNPACRYGQTNLHPFLGES